MKNKNTLKNILRTTVLAAVLLLAFVPVGLVNADPFQDQIDELDRKISQNNEVLQDLSARADTLEAKLRSLEAEVSVLSAQINKTKLQVEDVRTKLAKAEAELKRKKEILAENVRELYKNGDTSTLEVLASSNSFSDFVNHQEYLESVKISVQEAAAEVLALKEELEQREEELSDLLITLKAEEVNLQNRRDEQARLLAETRGEEARYQSIVESQQAELQRMQELQRRAYAADNQGDYISVGGSGGYPWAGQGLTKGGCNPSDCVDPWRLYKGQCTSYVAWRLDNEGYRVFSFEGRGNAAEWPDTTTRIWANNYGAANAAKRRATPKSGYAAVDPALAAPYGHVMYIEEVNSDGTLRISEYNYHSADTYSMRDNIDPNGLIFLEFARK